MLVEVKFKVDRLLARAVAKFAFNYVAFHAGRNFVLNTSFDPIRILSDMIKMARTGDSLFIFLRNHYCLKKPQNYA